METTEIFAAAWRRSHRKWYKTAIQYTNSKDLAHDIVFDTLLYLMEKGIKENVLADGAHHIDMYINNAVKYFCGTTLRKAQMLRTHIRNYYVHTAYIPYTAVPDFEYTKRADGLYLTDVEAKVLERERLLKGDERIVCTMFFREGKTVGAIAKFLGKQEFTIKRYVQRIRKLLVPSEYRYLIKNNYSTQYESLREKEKERARIAGMNYREAAEAATAKVIEQVNYDSFNATNMREIRKKQALEEWLQTQQVVRL